MTNIHQQINQALADLGTDVAATLKEQGITGRPGANDNCPIARYLRSKVTEDVWRVFVRETDIKYTHPGGYHQITPPGPVQKLIREFDQGMHPELEEQAQAVTA